MDLTRFFLIRHAEPDWAIADTKHLRGLQMEFCPLSQKGRRQARQIEADPSLRDAEIVVSSPYTRALQTAAEISKGLRLPLVVEYDLHEWLPDLRLQYTNDEVTGTIVKDFEKHHGEWPPGPSKRWETMGSVRQRVGKVLERYLEYSEVIVVCHGIVIDSQVEGVELRYAEMVELSI